MLAHLSLPQAAPSPLPRALLLAVVAHALALTLLPGARLTSILPVEMAPLHIVLQPLTQPVPTPASVVEHRSAQPAAAPASEPLRTPVRTASASPGDEASAPAASPLTAPANASVANEPAAVSQPAAPAVNSHTEPVRPPRFDAAYLNNPQPDYPLLSRKQKEEGRVLIRVRVSSSGLPTEIALQQSSGFSRLDQAALQKIREWRFVPARQGNDNVEGEVLVPLMFRLNLPA